MTKPSYVGELAAALARSIPDSQIDEQRVRTDRYRFVVISHSFEDEGHPARQRRVWDVAARTLSAAELRNVAMIITMSPSELPSDEVDSSGPGRRDTALE